MNNTFKQIIASVLLVSLLLQSCYNPNSLVTSNKKNINAKDLLPASKLDEDDTLADPVTASLRSSNKWAQANAPVLRDQLSTLEQKDIALATSTPLPATKDTLANDSSTKSLNNSVSSAMQPMLLTRPNYPVDNKQQATHYQRKQEAPLPAVNPLTTSNQPLVQADSSSASNTELSRHMQPLIAKGGEQVTFKQLPTGQWQAIVVDVPFHRGLHRKLELPVFLAPGESIEQAYAHAPTWHKRNIQVILQQGKGLVYVGASGLPGGMRPENRDVNSNSARSVGMGVEEHMETPAPSQLSEKLQRLYAQDRILPKLIEHDDMAEQNFEDYMKPQVVLREEAVGEKRPLELEHIFERIDEQHPAVKKILLLGEAGIGKSTLMQYISYQWANGRLWNDTFTHVFRVKLKELQDKDWATGRYDVQTELRKDKLACFIHYCLGAHGSQGISLEEVMNIADKDKVLLLLDGYDEIDPASSHCKEIISAALSYKSVIMASRPHAASEKIREKFGRQIEMQGLDEAGIYQHIHLHFIQPNQQGLGTSLQAFLANNNQLMGMCELPINTALLCTIWQDPTIRGQLQNQHELKLCQLYKGLTTWLGKRYASKYNREEAVWGPLVLEALEEVACKTFTGLGKERLPHSSISQDELGQIISNRYNGKGLKLEDLQNYGLLLLKKELRELEGSSGALQEVHCYAFIHQTFQEYLTACKLQKMLGAKIETKVRKATTWIAHHRNEPKYLMTLKFLAGLVSQSKDELLVKRFWETVSCNVDGILELGLEGKVRLLLHLLGQSQVGSKPDARIPNLEAMQQLINKVVLHDMIPWQQVVIESGYVSKELAGTVRNILGRRELQDENLLRAAANIAERMVNTSVFGTKADLFDRFIGFTEIRNWQVRKLGLEKAASVADVSIVEKITDEEIRKLCGLLIDETLREATTALLIKLNQPNPVAFLGNLLAVAQHATIEVKQAIVSLLPHIALPLPTIEDQRRWMDLAKNLLANKDTKEKAASSLREIAKLTPALAQEAMELIRPLLRDRNKAIKISAIAGLEEIVRLKPELAQATVSLTESLLNESKAVREGFVKNLGKIAETHPALAQVAIQQMLLLLTGGIIGKYTQGLKKIVVFNPPLTPKVITFIRTLLTNKNEQVRNCAIMGLEEIIHLHPQLAHEAIDIMAFLLADEDNRPIAMKSLKEIVKANPKSTEEVINLMAVMLINMDPVSKGSAVDELVEVVQLQPELGKGALDLIQILLGDEHIEVRKKAIEGLIGKENFFGRGKKEGLIGIVGLTPESANSIFSFITPWLQDGDEWIRKETIDGLVKVVKSNPTLAEDAFGRIKPLLYDRSEWVKRKAIKSLIEIVALTPGPAKMQLADEVFELVRVLLKTGQGKWDREKVSLTESLVEIIKLHPEWTKEAFDQITTLLNNNNTEVRKVAIKSLAEIAKTPESTKEVFYLIQSRLISEDAKDVKLIAAEKLVEILKSTPELVQETIKLFELINPLLSGNTNKYNKVMVAKNIEEIVKLTPELAQEAFNKIKPLLGIEGLFLEDNEVGKDLVRAVIGIFKEIAIREEAKYAFATFKPLWYGKEKWGQEVAADILEQVIKEVAVKDSYKALTIIGLLLDDGNEWGKKVVYNSLTSCFQELPIESQQTVTVFQKIIRALQDEEPNTRAGEIAKLKGILKLLPIKTQREVIKLLKKPFLAGQQGGVRWENVSNLDAALLVVGEVFHLDIVADLLADPSVNKVVRKGFIERLKLSEELARLDYTHSSPLLKILELHQSGRANEDDRLVQKGVKKVLDQIAKSINTSGVQWLCDHWDDLPHHIPTLRTFLKAVIHQMLSDQVIEDVEATLIIQCIVKKSITATIDPKDNKVLLEDNIYQLAPSSKKNLTYIVNEVIKTSQDDMARQYRARKPLFVNSGAALPVATADIAQVGSIVDNTELESEHWRLSVMDLSDQHQHKLINTFLLLEQRSYAGDHIIHQVVVDNSKLKTYSHVIHPNQVNTVFREKIFGDMEYDLTALIKKRYYGTSLTIIQEQGDKLLLACNLVQPPITDPYSCLHSLAASHITGTNTIHAKWEDYKQDLSVREYKKDALLKVEAAQVRRDSYAIDQAEQIQQLEDILKISGIKDDAAIKRELLKYKANDKALFDYCTTFIWTLGSYIEACRVANSGLIATNQEGSTLEKGGVYSCKKFLEKAISYIPKVAEKGLGMIPIIGEIVDLLLLDTAEAIHGHLKDAKQSNKIAVINQLLHRNHVQSSEVERSIANTALKIIKDTKKATAIISYSPERSKSIFNRLASNIGEKLSKLTNKLVRNRQLDESPQAELAVQDVILLMASLYTQYEALQASHSVELEDQMAKLVCDGNLADMISTSFSSANPVKLSVAQGVFKDEMINNFKKKAMQGRWEEYKGKSLITHKGCEQYFEEKYIIECLNHSQASNSQVPIINEENIVASQIVLFEVMNTEIASVTDPTKLPTALQCAEAFGKKYPVLTELIARTYPKCFTNEVIARCCIKDRSLLEHVMDELKKP